MSFSPYPEDDATTATPDASTRRRALIWAGGVSVAIVAVAAAGWLVFGNTGSGSDLGAGAGGPVVAPASADSPTGTDVSPGGASDGTASASRAAIPSRPGAPTGGPGTPAPGLPVSYRVTTDLCPSLDFAPLAGLAGAASGGAASEQKDYGESGYTDYSCLQKYDQGSANVQAEVFGDPVGATAWYDSSRANAPVPVDVPSVGTAAFEYLLPGNRIETYHLWVRDGNLGFGVTVQVKGDKLPGPNTLRASAVNVAKAAMPKLRG